jgi:phosphoglycolate/pyridoxal phosphate phosphatase family enzyme
VANLAMLSDVDLIVFDCDGVLWHGTTPVPGAAEALASLAKAGKRLFFVSNNSQYTMAAFEAKFVALGFGAFVRAADDEAVLWTSCLATRHWLEQNRGAENAAFVIGSEGLREAVSGAGWQMVHENLTSDERSFGPEECAHLPLDPAVRAVIVGFDRHVSYVHLALATRYLLENDDCRLVVTNRDYQFPAGPVRLPGTGALVSAVCTGARREPDVVTAKPSPYMLHAIMAAAHTPAERVLMVGDLWSDIAFGHRAGTRSALVLSGVTTAAAAKELRGESVPDCVLTDVVGLTDAARVVRPLTPPRSPAIGLASRLLAGTQWAPPVGAALLRRSAAVGVLVAAMAVGYAAGANGVGARRGASATWRGPTFVFPHGP